MKIIIITIILSYQFMSVACAESIDSMVALMSQKLGDMNSLNESIIRGGMRVRLCQYCHGKDGNSVKNDIPNLAQQNPVYLLTQFEYFRTDKRKNKVMNRLAKGLTEEERVNIALYFASQEVKPDMSSVNTNSGTYKRGAELYNGICVNCHGKKGAGERFMPRIASQKYSFLTKTLDAYKNKKGVRPDSPMVAVSAGLNESDIKAIATFVSEMK